MRERRVGQRVNTYEGSEGSAFARIRNCKLWSGTASSLLLFWGGERKYGGKNEQRLSLGASAD